MSIQNLKSNKDLVPKAKAIIIENRYSGREIPRIFGGDLTDPITSFSVDKCPIKSIVNTGGVSSIYLAFGHYLENDPQNGYTAIILGKNFNDELKLEESDVIYDVRAQEIDLPRLQTLAQDYYPNKAINNFDIDGNTTKLKGFSFPISEFATLLYKGAESFELVFGYHETTSPKNPQKGYTFILYGIKNGTRMDSDSDYIFDFCEPCPNVCPINDHLLYT